MAGAGGLGAAADADGSLAGRIRRAPLASAPAVAKRLVADWLISIAPIDGRAWLGAAAIGALGLPAAVRLFAPRLRRTPAARRIAFLAVATAAALIVAHSAAGPVTFYDTRSFHLQQVRWIRSYVSEGEGKIYCEFDAPSPESIREHARRAGLPADKISLVTMEINPAMYQ